MSNKNKNKAKYLKRKKLKQDARRRESEHVINYTECPVRDERVRSNRRSFDTGLTEMMLMMAMMRRRSHRNRGMAIMKKELEDAL